MEFLAMRVDVVTWQRKKRRLTFLEQLTEKGTMGSRNERMARAGFL
jgi:hypothetical protein